MALGLKMANLSLGGQNAEQAEKNILAYFLFLEKQKIKLEYQGKYYEAAPAELGISLNPDSSLRQAFSIGRKKNILAGLGEQIISFLRKYNLEADYSLNENELNNFIALNLNDIENPPRNSNLVFDNQKNNYEITPAEKGVIINRIKLKNDFKKIGYYSSIALLTIEALPIVDEKEAEDAKKSVIKIIDAAPYALVYQDQSWPIDKLTLIDIIGFAVTDNKLTIVFDKDKLKEKLKSIASTIDREATNAQLIIGEDGRANIFSLGNNGLKLDIEKNMNLIEENIKNQTKTTVLAINEIKPEITSNDDINNLGITNLISRGESNFVGSPNNRIHNIKLGASKMNGIILKPSEEFSFNKLLGEVDEARGYLPELVIKNHKTVPEYGGGLCQVSTTVFRAAINAGFQITERYAHPFAVKYYNPQGFDATIYPPHPDLKFINNTPNYILIQARIKGSKLIFEFYGTADNRDVKIKGPIIYESNPDGSLKTVLYQEIWRDGKLERKSTFWSNYQSPALYPVERNPLE